MQLIKPTYEIQSTINADAMLRELEVAGRTCYKSESAYTKESSREFVAMLLRRGHESVLEHEKITIKFICDRGVSHELVRHRIASFSQESTRYCNYAKRGLTFIIPSWESLTEREWTMQQVCEIVTPFESATAKWLNAMAAAEEYYNQLIKCGWKPEEARSVLPNSLKTEIVVTANLREWRLILKQRTAAVAHPQMRELMIPLLADLRQLLPVIFDTL